jgi:hypothetical protein
MQNSEVQMKLNIEPKNALTLGRAAEHLVVADLLLGGHQAFLTEQGMPYDVVIDHDGKIVRVQVKATCAPIDVNWGRYAQRIAYNWNIRARGKGRKARLGDHDCDLVALVALDIRVIAYIPVDICGTTIHLNPPGSELRTDLRSGSQWGRTVDQFPIGDALSDDRTIYRAVNRELTHCPHGHEYSTDNTFQSAAGSKVCRECSRKSGRDRMRVVRATARGEAHAV